MARRCRCGRIDTGSAEGVARAEAGTVVRAEEMTMCRHAGSAGRYREVEWQLCRIACLLEEQNGMMRELLGRMGEQK